MITELVIRSSLASSKKLLRNFDYSKDIIYEFLEGMRSPGFEFPLFLYIRRVPGYGLTPQDCAWKASVLTKLDDDRIHTVAHHKGY